MMVAIIAVMFMTWTNMNNVSFRIRQYVKSNAPATSQISHVEMLMPQAHFST
jgi:hypothetical protein